MKAFPLVLAASVLFGATACRPVVMVPSTTPSPALSPTAPLVPLLATSAQDAAAVASTMPTSATASLGRDSMERNTGASVALSNEEMTRTVVGVFGGIAGRIDSAEIASLEPTWDIDVQSYETHERVAHYVRLFSGDAGNGFSSRLSRGTRYDPMIRSKMRASGMPEDLSYLALIESGYDPHAYSRAAAVGMWQFMTATARDVGMRVDWWVDERRDPARSTEGAIRFLSELQKQFGGSLYLAAAAYNGGPGRVARGLTRYAGEMEGADGEDRFFALAEQGYLRAETKNYVPQLIGAALVAKTPGRYGLVVDTLPPLAYDSVYVGAGTSLAVVSTASSSSIAEMKDLNPAILRGVVPPDAGRWVYVPLGRATGTDSALRNLSAAARSGFSTTKVTGTTTTPAAVAKSEGLTLKQLHWYNPTLKTTSRGRLVAGQSVRIPVRDVLAYAREFPDPSIERYGGGAAKALASSGYHVVRRGETLGGIAKRYRTTVARLQSNNGMKGTRVIAGQTLNVSTASRSVTTKKAVVKKSAVKKSVVKKSAVKKPVVKKPTVKKKPAVKH